jgi:predicted DNA-binding protein (MmcQ/YjbR family)
MARKGAPLERLRAICLGLPDTKETPTWGEPHFRVGEKIFAGYGEKDGRATIGFKLTKPHAEAVINDPRFERAPYVGKHGWVSMDATRVTSWDDVAAMVLESYTLIASKSSLAKLEKGAKKPEAAPVRRKSAGRGARPRQKT